MKIDPNKIPVYITLGGEVIKVATGSIKSIRAAFASQPDVAVDNAQLDRIDAEYSSRIDDAKREAGGQ